MKNNIKDKVMGIYSFNPTTKFCQLNFVKKGSWLIDYYMLTFEI